MRKFLTYTILISFLFYALFYDGVKNHAYATEQYPFSFDGTWDGYNLLLSNYAKKSFSGMEDGFLDFKNGKFRMVQNKDGYYDIIHEWGGQVNGKPKFSLTYSQSIVNIQNLSKTDLSGTVTYKRHYDIPDKDYKFTKNNANDVDLKVFRTNLGGDTDFGLLVEMASPTDYRILGIFWINEDNATINKDCNNSSAVQLAISVPGFWEKMLIKSPFGTGWVYQYGSKHPGLPTDYTGDIQGDSAGKAGLCAYDPMRLKDTRVQQDKIRGEKWLYYIYNLNDYFADLSSNIKLSVSGLDKTQKTDQCLKDSKTFLDKPLTVSDKAADKKVYEALKNNLVQGLDPNAATAIQEYLNENNLVSESDDWDLYRKYYRSEGSSYVNKEVDRNLLGDFNDLMADLKINQAVMTANDKNKDQVNNWKTTVQLAGGGVIGYQMTVKTAQVALPWLYKALSESTETLKSPAAQAVVRNANPELLKTSAAIKEAVTAGEAVPDGYIKVTYAATKLKPASEEYISKGLFNPEELPLIEKGAQIAADGSLIEAGTVTEASGTWAAIAGGAGSVMEFLGPVVLIALVAVIAYFAYLTYVGHQAVVAMRDLVRDLVKVELAYTYILSNRLFQKCAGTWTDDQESIFQQITVVKDEGVQSAKSAINAAYKDICPHSEVLSPPTWFLASICGIGMALWEAGQNLMKFASQQFEQVLGIKYGLGY